MKKNLLVVLCAALVVCLMLTLVGCGVAGRYVLMELSYEGNSISADDAGMEPEDCYIEMNADGTAVLCLEGDKTDMEWKDGQIWAVDEENSEADFQIDEGLLTINVDGIEMVFEKE